MMISYLVMATISGCAQWGAAKQSIAAAGEEAANESLKVSLWNFCKAASIGSIERWVGGNQELANARKIVCSKDEQANVVNVND